METNSASVIDYHIKLNIIIKNLFQKYIKKHLFAVHFNNLIV